MLAGNQVEEVDAERDLAARADLVDSVIVEIGDRPGHEVDERDIHERLSEMRDAIDAGRSDTVVLRGRSWAVISSA